MDDERLDTIRVRLDLGWETIWLTRFDREGRAVGSYPVHWQAAASAFTYGFDTGLLGPDTLFYQNQDGAVRIGVFVKAGVQQITLVEDSGVGYNGVEDNGVGYNGERRTVTRAPMPGMVFVGRGCEYSVWAVKERPKAEDDRLFTMPLPNVYADGKICWGNVKPPVCGVWTIGTAVRLFFEAEFSTHLTAGKLAGGQDLIGLLRSLDGKRTFPERLLVAVSRTVGQVIKGQTDDQ